MAAGENYEEPLLITGQNIAGTIYEYDHFSGSQVAILVGDVFIDNAVSLAFSVEQSKAPVFGYASQYYSFLSDGHVFVQGSLTVAFKEAGYLLSSLQRYAQLIQDSSYTTPRFTSSNGKISRGVSEKDTYGIKTLSELSAEARYHENLRQTAEQVRSLEEWEKTASPSQQGQYRGAYHDFWNKLGHLPDNRWEDWAEAFEDAIWYGSDSQNPFSRDKLNSKNITLYDAVKDDELVLSHRRADQYLPVDIWITYGDLNSQQTNHTVRKLMDVSFVGQSQTLEVSGSPVFETYNFIARNLV